MYLVAGLGNPGAKYEETRHNVGFMVIDELAKRAGAGAWKSTENALVSRGKVAGHDAWFVKPQTFMNLSGDAVGTLLRYHKIEAENLIVVHDELDFELGAVRLKLGGGHGGHNGIRSVIAHVNRDFARVRVGVGKPRSKEEGADHVLSRFDKSERRIVEQAVAEAAAAVEMMIELGVTAAMNQFNRRA